MLSLTRKGVAAGAELGGEREGGRPGFGVQDWSDGSRYEGGFVDGLKHGSGRYSWRNGEFYEGSFYKDYRHGNGVYSWPTGHTFTGKFYLNRKEGCGRQLSPDGTVFQVNCMDEGRWSHVINPLRVSRQGLYHADQRFGPGVVTYPDGRQDVGLWVGERLLRLCTSVEDGFSLQNLPQYAAFTPSHTRTQSEVCRESGLLSDERFIYPPGMESYSTDGDHLPLPPGRRRELDQHFYGELWEPDAQLYQGYERDPLSSLPLEARMQQHMHRHRLQADSVDWDMAAVLSLSREGFGPTGPLEVTSELLIQHAARGDLQAVSQILQTGLVHPDIADSHGHTALLAATVNCHDDVIQLLLDTGADIDRLNCEGMSALAVCHVLYYPFHSLNTTLAEPCSKPQDAKSECGNSPRGTRDTPGPNRPQTANTTLSNVTNQSHLSEPTHEERICHRSIEVSSEEELITEHWTDLNEPHTPAESVYLEDQEERGEKISETQSEAEIQETEQRSQKEEGNKAKETKAVDKHDQTWQSGESQGGAAEDDELKEEAEGGADAEEPEEERSILVSDGHMTLGSVRWKGRDGAAAGSQAPNKELTQNQIFDSARSVRSYEIQVTEELMQRSAEALSCAGVPLNSDSQETVRRMAAMKIQHRVRLNTLKLLLQRGADPNASTVPAPVLSLAVMAGDTEAVRRLLLCGARADAPLPPEVGRKGLRPLHIAASLPGPAGPRITELLLHALADPDAQACDQDELYGADQILLKPEEPLDDNGSPDVTAGGRTALHVACHRDSDYANASKVVALLLSHRARTDLLWSGHSALSLAIASGNDLAVEELLKGGADPNLPLGPRVGSALCALSDINYHLGGNRAKLLDMLAKAGADMLMPVRVRDAVGTAVDFAHYSFSQDLRIANTPFHALNMREREIFKTRQQLLSMMGDLLRQAAAQRERERSEGASLRSKSLLSSESPPHLTEKHRNPVFRFCYHCGRSLSVKLTACRRCSKVFFCSRTCTVKAWDKRHKEECTRVSASANGILKTAVSAKAQRGPSSRTTTKTKTAPSPSRVRLKSQRTAAENVWDSQLNLTENYSHN
ncbi:ankyrin repeat and MYND domain-containing protein 1-like isoform X2 [Betta splendens]|uniref:Ankyrin repeat and MYND domain-containing protein 1-like isoform X2 n=1 Tax=Betta splendens TaxID=158456 RepID=A0A6P7M952_BETSP|nr:ankyrin repeat and MYND domain-containing protein 1-like isoform X2 [Betta splendens]